MPDLLQRAIASLMNRVRVNRLRESLLDNTPVFIKSRRRLAGPVIAAGNLFLSLSHPGVRMFVRTRPWIDSELHCFGLLYPDRPPARAAPPRAVLLPRFPGLSLRVLLHQDQATPAAFRAAARELHRVHQLSCPYFRGPWSHGDLHLDNILYHSASDRAFLLDFDTRHTANLPALRRHADDLLVPLLELLAHPSDRCLTLAAALIETYHDPTILCELRHHLTIPRGFARILWLTRIYGASPRIVEQRLEFLRTILDRITSPASPEIPGAAPVLQREG